MKRILLTGGRAPVALELARLFHDAGHFVCMAESVRWPLTWSSRAIMRHYQVPPPNREPDAYLDALLEIIQQEKIDLLLPTCEELFYVARGYEQLAAHCDVFVEPLARLRPLHNKWHFIQRAQHYNLTVPPTRLLTTQADVRSLSQEAHDLVFKPVYSRFASQTIIRPQEQNRTLISCIQPTPQQPWIAQTFIHGRQICTYSLAYKGRLVAHTAYPTEFSAGQGATILFRHIDHSAAFKWVSTFVEREQFTGQIAFDFIESSDKRLFALECNPRATSGIHLLAQEPGCWRLFFEPNSPLLTPSRAEPVMLASAMLLYGLPAIRSYRQLKEWTSCFSQSRSILFRRHDPLPALFQFVGVANFLWWSIKHNVSALQASTFDIEWNGQ